MDKINDKSLTLQEEQIKLLYRNFGRGAIGSLLVSLLFAAAMWERSPDILPLWLATVWMITFLRGMLVWRYFQVVPAANQLQPWIILFVTGTALAGGGWGLAAYLFISGTDMVATMLVTFFLAGVTSASILVLAPVLRAAEIFVLSALVPMILRLFLMEDSTYWYMGAASSVHLFVLLSAIRRNHATTWNTLLTEITNAQLKKRIAVEKARAEEREKTVTRLMELEHENTFFRDIVERTSDFPITVHDMAETESQFVYANDAACRHFGVDKKTLLTMTPGDFDPHYAPSLELDVRISAHESVIFETEHRVANGDIVPVEVALHPLQMGDKLLSVAYTHDIRERKAHEEQRKKFEAALAKEEVEKRHRGLIEALPDFIARLDTQARLIYISPQSLNNMKLSEADLLGKTALEISFTGGHERDQRLYQSALHAINTGETHHYQDWWEMPHGKRCFDLRNIPEKDDNDKVISVLGIARDITERAQVENALQFIAKRGWSRKGESFLSVLTRYLGETLEVDYVIIDKLADDNPDDAETVAVFAKGEILPNLRYCLKGTPCENVMEGTLCSYPQKVQQQFPDDELLVEMKVESYIGLPLWDSFGKTIGLIAIMNSKPMPEETVKIATRLLNLVTIRAAAELEREHSEQELQAREREYRRLLDNSPDVIVRYDHECRRTYSNAAHSKTLIKPVAKGTTPVEDWGLPTDISVAETYQSHLQKVLDTGKPDEWELEWIDSNGNPVCNQARGVPEFDLEGRTIGVLVISRDISERLLLEEELRRQASYDAVTGLPNRWLFGDRLQEEINRAKRNNGSVALLFIDLDRFKEVNDTLGHETGDQLLKEAAQRIQSCVRESDTIARLGGDEFVAILPGVQDVVHLGNVAQKIIDVLGQAFFFDKYKTHISASIGIASYPADADDAKTLVSCADQAMYYAKEGGRNDFHFFTASMQRRVEGRLHLTNDLRQALSQQQFLLHYQPIIDTTTGRVIKAEALLRWQHPEQGMVPPDRFIPIAEETDLIHELGDWAFHEAVKTTNLWREQSNGAPVQISVNVSPRQFLRGWFLETWIRHLADMAMPPECMAIEITEGLLLSEQTDIQERLNRLRRAGMQVALDDFGTGYSAMSYLKKFNIDYLKIDRSFVRDMETDESDRAIAETIVIMAKRLGLKTIAEGVETIEQRDILAAVGCDYVQGYLYAKPMLANEFLEYVIASSKD